MAAHAASNEDSIIKPEAQTGYRNPRDKTYYGDHAAGKGSVYSNFAGFGSEDSEDEQEERRNSLFENRSDGFRSNDSPSTISPKSDGDHRDISLFNTCL